MTSGDQEVIDKVKDMEVYVNLKGTKSDSGVRWLYKNASGLAKFQPKQVRTYSKRDALEVSLFSINS